MLVYQLHMACSRSNEDGGLTEHVTGTASPWLRINSFWGLCSVDLQKGHIEEIYFRYNFHLMLAATTDELLSMEKNHFLGGKLRNSIQRHF